MDEKDKIPQGMTEDMADTFAIAQQDMLYRLIDEHDKLKRDASQKEREYLSAKSSADYTEQKIVAVLTYLDVYNKGAHEDWFAEVGYRRPTGVG